MLNIVTTLQKHCGNVLITSESDVVTTSETDVVTTVILDRVTTLWFSLIRIFVNKDRIEDCVHIQVNTGERKPIFGIFYKVK